MPLIPNIKICKTLSIYRNSIKIIQFTNTFYAWWTSCFNIVTKWCTTGNLHVITLRWKAYKLVSYCGIKCVNRHLIAVPQYFCLQANGKKEENSYLNWEYATKCLKYLQLFEHKKIIGLLEGYETSVLPFNEMMKM